MLIPFGKFQDSCRVSISSRCDGSPGSRTVLLRSPPSTCRVQSSSHSVWRLTTAREGCVGRRETPARGGVRSRGPYRPVARPGSGHECHGVNARACTNANRARPTRVPRPDGQRAWSATRGSMVTSETATQKRACRCAPTVDGTTGRSPAAAWGPAGSHRSWPRRCPHVRTSAAARCPRHGTSCRGIARRVPWLPRHGRPRPRPGASRPPHIETNKNTAPESASAQT